MKYKFEIVADSVEELEEKINEFRSVGVKIESDEQKFEAAQMPQDEVVEEVAEEEEIVQGTQLSEKMEDALLDSRGIPWDARVHSPSKATTKEGHWRYRRNLEDAYIKSIEKEISTPQAVSQTVVASVTTPVPAAIPLMPTPEAKKPLGYVHDYASFKTNLGAIISMMVKDGKITQEYVQQLCTYFKVQDIWNILASEKQCLELYDSFCRVNLIKAT